MDFDLTAEQREIQALAREFADAEIEPHAAEWDRSARLSARAAREARRARADGRLRPGGVRRCRRGLRLVHPRARGAVARRRRRRRHRRRPHLCLHAAAARSSAPTSSARASCRRSRAASAIGCFALTESGAGSDAGALVTRADADGDGWHVSGAKQWITNAAFGGTVLLFARTDAETRSARGVSAFVVDTDQVTITRDRGEARAELVGRRTTSPSIRVVGDGSVDRRAATTAFGSRWRRSTAAGSGSPRRRSGSRRPPTTSRARTRRSARRSGIRSREFQAIQHKLANMSMEIDAARLLTSARGLAEGAGPPAHGSGSEGEAVRLGDGATPDRRGDPGARRVRLHEGVPGRALLPRREDHRDLRGHERDPAARDRARDPRAAGRMPTAS